MWSSSSLKHLSDKYCAYYSGKEGCACLLDMIERAKKIGENACSLFEEHASPFHDPSITADDLEHLFEHSIYTLIKKHLKENDVHYLRILKFRAALSRDCSANVPPIVTVQYFLVWKKTKTEESLSSLEF